MNNTRTINTLYKEAYYTNKIEAIKESSETIRNRQVVWNYMINMSIQNTVSQMRKAA